MQLHNVVAVVSEPAMIASIAFDVINGIGGVLESGSIASP